MDAEEVDFGGFEDCGADAEGDGDAGDEGDEFAGFGGADADVPVGAPARGFEGPAGDWEVRHMGGLGIREAGGDYQFRNETE